MNGTKMIFNTITCVIKLHMEYVIKQLGKCKNQAFCALLKLFFTVSLCFSYFYRREMSMS